MTPSLDELGYGPVIASFDPPPTTTKENIDQARFWVQIGWAGITEDENRNVDLVPAYFDKLLESGCPECGSAWWELVAIGFTAQRATLGTAKWFNGTLFIPGSFHVSTNPIEGLDTRAVRVQCCDGHTFDFDSYTKRVRKHEPLSWLLPSVALLSVFYGLYRPED